PDLLENFARRRRQSAAIRLAPAATCCCRMPDPGKHAARRPIRCDEPLEISLLRKGLCQSWLTSGSFQPCDGWNPLYRTMRRRGKKHLTAFARFLPVGGS